VILGQSYNMTCDTLKIFCKLDSRLTFHQNKHKHVKDITTNKNQDCLTNTTCYVNYFTLLSLFHVICLYASSLMVWFLVLL